MEGVGLFTYAGTADDELSFQQGDTLKIISFAEDRNWFKAELQGRQGFVPKNYIKMNDNYWYMGNMSRIDAQQFLLRNDPKLEDGSFIVRDSESQSNSFAISVRFRDQVQHYKILKNDDGMYLLWVVQFESINQLINYHRQNSVARTRTILLKDFIEKDQLRTVKAIHDFAPQDIGEIGFSRDDEILVLDDSDSNWWRGRTKKDENFNIGIFPSNYVHDPSR